jgi:hypothetical protein
MMPKDVPRGFPLRLPLWQVLCHAELRDLLHLES